MKKRRKKLKNRSNVVVIVVLSFLASFLLAIQFKGINSNIFSSGMNKKQSEDYFNIEYKRLLKENEILKEQNTNYKNELKEINENILNNSEFNYLKEEIEKYKKYSGFTDVKGPGIIIKFDIENSNNTGLSGDFYSQLVLLVNELNSSGSEAISINGDRIVANTEIRLAGDFIVINSKKYSPPFLIKAIGDKETLHNSLTSRFGFVDITRERGYFIEIKKEEIVNIPKYEGAPEYRFLEDVED